MYNATDDKYSVKCACGSHTHTHTLHILKHFHFKLMSFWSTWITLKIHRTLNIICIYFGSHGEQIEEAAPFYL